MRLTPKMKECAEIFVNNPELTCKEVGAILGVQKKVNELLKKV